MAEAASVPASVAVPAAPALKVTPDGSAPDSDSVGVGMPVAVIAKVPAVPEVKVVEAAEVINNDPLVTVKVNSWVEVATLLAAVNVRSKVPVVRL